MLLPDVNVLIYAFDTDAANHPRFRAWLREALEGDETIGIADVIMSGVVRIVTHPRILRQPASIDQALDFVAAVRDAPASVPAVPGEQHWTLFERLCRSAGAKGNLVPDAYVAALAIEHRATLVTTDRDFSRFAGLRVRHPLDPSTGTDRVTRR